MKFIGLKLRFFLFPFSFFIFFNFPFLFASFWCPFPQLHIQKEPWKLMKSIDKVMGLHPIDRSINYELSSAKRAINHADKDFRKKCFSFNFKSLFSADILQSVSLETRRWLPLCWSLYFPPVLDKFLVSTRKCSPNEFRKTQEKLNKHQRLEVIHYWKINLRWLTDLPSPHGKIIPRFICWSAVRIFKEVSNFLSDSKVLYHSSMLYFFVLLLEIIIPK